MYLDGCGLTVGVMGVALLRVWLLNNWSQRVDWQWVGVKAWPCYGFARCGLIMGVSGSGFTVYG